jgi:hypothetical protein
VIAESAGNTCGAVITHPARAAVTLILERTGIAVAALTRCRTMTERIRHGPLPSPLPEQKTLDLVQVGLNVGDPAKLNLKRASYFVEDRSVFLNDRAPAVQELNRAVELAARHVHVLRFGEPGNLVA